MLQCLPRKEVLRLNTNLNTQWGKCHNKIAQIKLLSAGFQFYEQMYNLSTKITLHKVQPVSAQIYKLVSFLETIRLSNS